jgi:glycosyltransferase involved in cell wall biosynthesis
VLSFIVPAYNEELELPATIESIRAAAAEIADYELIVVDDGSTDATAKIGRFDEALYVGEEVYFSLALRKLGRFKILREAVVTSGRKLRMYSARQIVLRFVGIVLRGKRGAMSRDRLDLWYDGRRERREHVAASLGRGDSRRHSAVATSIADKREQRTIL